MPRFRQLPTGCFNPRTPCGVRPKRKCSCQRSSCFNPRTPCGVRLNEAVIKYFVDGFNPRTPCGVRPKTPFVYGNSIGFNPRTPCGVRQKIDKRNLSTGGFQSTHSLRSATIVPRSVQPSPRVSIHALLAECDKIPCVQCHIPCRFNPRTPCGVRLGVIIYFHQLISFNPRTPCGVRQLNALIMLM